MKKTCIVLCCALLAIACGNSGESKTGDNKKDSAASSQPTVANQKGLELIAASDCTTCHKLDQASTGGMSIGPAYSEVAKKYAPAADTTVARLVQKIINGGTGVWGQLPMTAHAALPPADVKEMVTYILSLKK
jgi:cytochrome c